MAGDITHDTNDGSPNNSSMAGAETQPSDNMTDEQLWERNCNASQPNYGAIFQRRLYNLTSDLFTTGPFCNRTFDGWLCWPDTPAGFSAIAPCPAYVTGFAPYRWGHKDCDENGFWFRQPEFNNTWSNYTDCVDLGELEWMLTMNTVYKTGYMVSLVALLLSVTILLYFKSLRCARNTLHINLFLSFAFNNFLWLLWYWAVVEDPKVSSENGVPCQVLHVVVHYFMLSNYSWMLCEGFYLHTLLVFTFISESRLVMWLMVYGWTSPAPFVIAYAVRRGMDEDVKENIECWLYENSKHTLILTIHVAITMACNALFMASIMRVLVIKLRAGPRVGSSRPSSTLLQALKAMLLLAPLLGLQYLLTPFKPEKEVRGPSLRPSRLLMEEDDEEILPAYSRMYDMTVAISSSFQGLCVATLFCFCNGEVIAQVKRRWQHLMFRPRANSCTATTVSFIRSANGPMTGEDNV